MKKKLILFSVVCITTLCLTSCGMFSPRVLPKAVNTVNTVGLSELNLVRADYQILNTVTAEATIKCEYDINSATITDESGDFKLIYNVKNGVWTYKKHKGILRLGYLARDISDETKIYYPEDIARRFAIYRLINAVQEYGADGIIEPTVSTNVEQINKDDVVYKTTVTGKIIKLKTN